MKLKMNIENLAMLALLVVLVMMLNPSKKESWSSCQWNPFSAYNKCKRSKPVKSQCEGSNTGYANSPSGRSACKHAKCSWKC